MGRTSHTTPAEFSKKFNDLLRQVVVARGGASDVAKTGVSVRWAEEHIGGRGRTYWNRLFDDATAMTTEDIALVSDWLGVSPFEFVRAVREGNADLVVGGSTDDDAEVLMMPSRKEKEIRQSAPIAANRDDKK